MCPRRTRRRARLPALRRRAASPGIGIGPLCRLEAESPRPGSTTRWLPDRPRPSGVVSSRRSRTSAGSVERLRSVTARGAGAAEAAVFDAHLLLLDDAELMSSLKHRIAAGAGAAEAWAATVSEIETEWAALPDPYLRARAEDVRAVGDAGAATPARRSTARQRPVAGVLVARTLTPADVAEMDAGLRQGDRARRWQPHVARRDPGPRQGIPAVVGPGRRARPSRSTHCSSSTAHRATRRRPVAVRPRRVPGQAATARRGGGTGTSPRRPGPRVTRDGARVQVVANVGSLADARACVLAGRTASGCCGPSSCSTGGTALRTSRSRSASTARSRRPWTVGRMVVRTLDAGGDKPLPFLSLPEEDNPFLGVRGIRLAWSTRSCSARSSRPSSHRRSTTRSA